MYRKMMKEAVTFSKRGASLKWYISEKEPFSHMYLRNEAEWVVLSQ